MSRMKWPTTAAASFPLGALDWQQRSVCQWTEPGLFDAFRGKASEEEWARVARAQEVCARCPVRAECLEFGLSEKLSGVWGGEYLMLGQPVAMGTRLRRESLRPEATAA